MAFRYISAFYLFFFSLSVASASNSGKCYSPAGTLSLIDKPCDTSASESFCCPPTAICSSNKLCILPSGQPLRGSCTDSSWNSRECPNFCLGDTRASRQRDKINMTLCETDRDSTSYCCNLEAGKPCDCSNENPSIVKLHLFNPITTIPAATNRPITTVGPPPLPTELSSPIRTAAQQHQANQAFKLMQSWMIYGPILLGLLVGVLSIAVIYAIRRLCLASRSSAHKRGGSIEAGRRKSSVVWAAYLTDKAAESNFSIGSSDTQIDPLSTRHNGSLFCPASNVGPVEPLTMERKGSIFLPDDDGARNGKTEDKTQGTLKGSPLDTESQVAFKVPAWGKDICDPLEFRQTSTRTDKLNTPGPNPTSNNRVTLSSLGKRHSVPF